ncbi:MAG: tetratricopeptide repeat protein [Nitrosomonas communis]|nr:tetratricopeptide repeat protein [Nitrosomonas communis]MCO6426974.1 tetratricopeptide repeat protein [Nitrosomonas communis]
MIPLLCLDQFEEIFSLARENPQRSQEVKQFTIELADLVEGRCPETIKAHLDDHPDKAKIFSFSRQPYKIILSLREDYLADLEGLRKGMPSVIHNRMRLTPMSGDQALTVADQTQGRLMETSVAESIVRLVAGEQGETYEALTELRIEPALLSLVCRELNEQRIAYKARQINAQSVTTSNREQILENFYDRSLENESSELRQFIEDRLITLNGFRNSEAYDNALGIAGITPEALFRLVKRRLLRLEERGGVKRIELIHDVLTSVVRKSRDQRWVLERQRQAEAAREKTEEAFRASKRRAVFYLVMLFIASCASLWGWWSWWDAEEARMTADQERFRSDKLLSFMLSEKLQAEMRDIGRGDLLELVQKKSEENLKDQSFNRGLALRNSGNLNRSRGQLNLAIENFLQAQAIFERFIDTKGDKAKIELARTLVQMGDVLSDKGKLSKALKVYEQAVQIRRYIATQYTNKISHELFEIYEQNSTPALELAETLDGLGTLYFRIGEVSTAFKHYEEAISIAVDHLFEPINLIDESAAIYEYPSEPNFLALKVLASVLANKSVRNVWITNERRHFDSGLFIMNEYLKAKPLSAVSRHDESRIIFWLSQNDNISIDDKLAVIRKVIEGFEMLRRVDSKNFLWRNEWANIQWIYGDQLLDSCSTESQSCSDKNFTMMEAKRRFHEGLEQLRVLVEMDKANLSWKLDLAAALRDYAISLKKKKKLPFEYMSFLDEAIEIYSQLILDINDTETRTWYAWTYKERASGWQQLGKAEKALEDLQQARIIYEDLVNRLPDHPYFGNLLIQILDDEISLREKNSDDSVLVSLIKRRDELKLANKVVDDSDNYQNSEWTRQKEVAEEAKQKNKPEVATAAYQIGIKALLEDAKADPKRAEIWNQLAQAQYQLAEVFYTSNLLAKSIATYREAILSAKEATVLSPEKDNFQNWLHVIHFALGVALQETKELESARDQFLDSLIPLKVALKLNSTESVYHQNAREAYRMIYLIEQELLKHNPGNYSRLFDGRKSALQQRLYAAWNAMAFSSNQERALQLQKLFMARRDLAEFLAFEKQDLKQALSLMEQVVIDAEKTVADKPKNPELYCRLGEADYAIGMLRREQLLPGWEESIRKGLLAIDWGISIAKKEEPICHIFSGAYRKNLGKYLLKDGRADDGKEELKKALSASQKVLQYWPNDEQIKQDIEVILQELSAFDKNSDQPFIPILKQPTIPIPAIKPLLTG